MKIAGPATLHIKCFFKINNFLLIIIKLKYLTVNRKLQRKHVNNVSQNKLAQIDCQNNSDKFIWLKFYLKKLIHFERPFKLVKMSVKNGAVPNEESKTAFSVLSAHFPEPGEKLKTLEFLEASAGVVTLVEKLGKIFSPVISDINGNIKKLLESYNKDPETNEYLEDMILKEQVEGSDGKGIATDALLWLRRALHFKSIFFQLIIMDTDSQRLVQDLTPFMKRAYSESLERYHGWLGSQLFHVISRFIPSRKSLLFTLAMNRHNKEEEVIRDMRQYNFKLSGCVAKLTQFYMEQHLEPI